MITKYNILLIVAISILMTYSMSCEDTLSNPAKITDDTVLNLIDQMSIEEKVGQMTQITLGTIMTEGQLDIEKLRECIVEKNVGSILNVDGAPLGLTEWHILLSKIQDVALNETRLSIPILYGIDAIHGTNYTRGSTLFPHNIGMGATRNTDLVYQSAKITAMETRASGIRWNFDPALGIARQPLWSRFEEMYGEATFLASAMGAKAIEAYEEDGLNEVTAVASCMKHYIGYSVPQSGKDRTPSYIPETQLREIFLPPFQKAVESGTSTVMINSGEINGVPVHASKYYLTDILRNELGFEGLAVTDWEDIIRLHARHHVASSPKEAVKLAINAGIDMSMVPNDYSFYDLLIQLVKDGEVPESRIDEAVYRILKLKSDLGLFDNAYPEKEAQDNFGKESYHEVALNAALESITLLKNEKTTLPLNKNSKILLTGPTANNLGALHGSWSYTWQGDDEREYNPGDVTLKKALEDKIGKDKVICNATNRFTDSENTNVSFIKKNASMVDVIVLALGEKAYAESPGGIHDLDLEQNQIDLAQTAFETGKPVVLLLAEGRPRVISPIAGAADAIVQLYRPGSQGAEATMKILFGDYNPNGKLPYSYPRFSGDIILYDRKHTEEVTEFIPDSYGGGGYNPQWELGHGLSYTTFEYGDIDLKKTSFAMDESVQVSLSITNTGTVAGKHSIDVFLKDNYASVTPSFKKLVGFKKEFFEAGETKTIQFELDKEHLSMVNASGKWVLEEGEFTVTLGNKTSTFTLGTKSS